MVDRDTLDFTVVTAAANQTITIPYVAGSPIASIVYWGDGTASRVSSNTDPNRIHTYTAAGTYKIKITGIIGNFNFSAVSASATNVVSVQQGRSWSCASLTFQGCTNLTQIPTYGIHLLRASNTQGLFFNSAISSLPSTFKLKTYRSTNIASLFQNCASMVGSLSVDFLYAPLATNCLSVFSGCAGLTGAIPSDLFDSLSPATNLSNFLLGCIGLTGSIPSGLFNANVNCTNYNSLFMNCSGLTGSIPSALFPGTLCTNFMQVFSGCSNLSGSIPSNVFGGHSSCTQFNSAFRNCSGLTGSIPSGLFPSSVCTTFSAVFQGCSGLTGSIPTGLFPGSSCTSFSLAFQNCSGLTGAIPAATFGAHNSCATYQQVFQGCSGLTGSIPSGLFPGTVCTIFSNVFNGCSSLSGLIPTGLFTSHTAATTFASAFVSCTGITGCAGTIFPSSTTVTNMTSVFNSCSNAAFTTLPANFWDGLTKVTTYTNALTSGRLSAATVDAWLISIDTFNTATGARAISYSPITGNGHLDANRSGTALTAKNSLVTKGWVRTGTY